MCLYAFGLTQDLLSPYFTEGNSVATLGGAIRALDRTLQAKAFKIPVQRENIAGSGSH